MEKTKHIEIEYEKRDGVTAIAVNRRTGKRFLLSNYANAEKAEKLAPKLLWLKAKAPSEQFGNFLKD